VIIEDRIRDWEAGRKPGIHSFRAANGIAQFLPSALAHPYGISNRDLTMRPASASRLTRAHLAKGPSAPRRTTQGLCSAISNRELTMRRASASRASAPRRTTRGICSAFSSSGLPANLGGNNSQLLPQNLPQIRKWSRPLLTGSALQTEFGLTYRKQTTEKFLTGARTHTRETRFAQHSDASPLGFPK
jgi:hypothetical protein